MLGSLPADHPVNSLLARSECAYRGPYILFDRQAISRSISSLLEVGRPFGVRFIAAVKSLPSAGMLKTVVAICEGIDISNIEELARFSRYRQTYGRGRIPYASLTGPAIGVGSKVTERVIELLTVNVECVSQLKLLDRISAAAANLELGARIGIKSLSHNEPTRFGFCPHDIQDLKVVAANALFGALHCHLGKDGLVNGAAARAAKSLLSIAHSTGMKLRRINLGGGFGEQTIEQIRQICEQVRAVVPSDVEIVFEPGAWLTQGAGYALCRVLSMRYRRDLDATIVIVDLSRLNHLKRSTVKLLGWWGKKPSISKIMIFGPTCYEYDHLLTQDWDESTPIIPSEGRCLLLLGGVSGYDLAFNTTFNGIRKANVIEF